ncbi:MAG: hypothetical protein M1837_001368 [Sclerophora amabilis]|nr:MAG: hypothetical protein M1837_001368 [Sclerophora amabilis]
MAAQAVLIAETIAGMKKALSRRSDASDSDDSIHRPTNRGNKLKRKARFVREGHLDLPSGPRVYKRKIDHAGYRRYVISRNPSRFDEDGDELDEDDVDEQADAAAAEEDPYSSIRIENTLAPLTSAADLPNHPSLSAPYHSRILTRMAQYAGDVTQKEKASLWRTKQLLTKFRGDHKFAPCGLFESENDNALFEPHEKPGDVETVTAPQRRDSTGYITTEGEQEQMDRVFADGPSKSDQREGSGLRAGTASLAEEDGRMHALKVKEEASREVTMTNGMEAIADSLDEPCAASKAGTRDEIREAGHDQADAQNDKSVEENVDPATAPAEKQDREDRSNPADRAKTSPHPKSPNPKNADAIDPSSPRKVTSPAEDDATERPATPEDENSVPPPHRMTTRAQAQQAASTTTPTGTPRSGSLSPTSSSSPFIHPLFLVAANALPDRDFGLPAPEAEETRRLLLSAVQKQEEVCRGHEKLYEGLLRADRMRREVLKWTKAEAHVGELSDGEDWYDKEEWGLDEDLKKGNEEDEDEGGNQGKRTRGRRN